MQYRFSLLIGLSIAVLSLIPGDKLPETDIRFADLIVHVVMYLTWMLIYQFEVQRQFEELPIRYIINGLFIIITFGGIMEICQENLIQGRFGSWSDFAANTFGAFLGLIIYRLKPTSRGKQH